jgi:predicted deacetylase
MTLDHPQIRSGAQYLLRFDDLCPTMNHANWTRWEQLVERHGIKPLVAVVPDNRDPDLSSCAPDPDFWPHLRALQARGWTIAIHGYQHDCDVVGRSLVPIHRRSEFAGLGSGLQLRKLQTGMEVLRSHGLEPTVWVAPRHGFDANTVEALKAVGIRVISDGLSAYPHLCQGVFWIPQQLWAGKPRRFGVWTICIHANESSDAQFRRFEEFMRRERDKFATVEDIIATYGERRRSFVDLFYESYHLGRIRLRSRVRRMSHWRELRAYAWPRKPEPKEQLEK